MDSVNFRRIHYIKQIKYHLQPLTTYVTKIKKINIFTNNEIEMIGSPAVGYKCI